MPSFAVLAPSRRFKAKNLAALIAVLALGGCSWFPWTNQLVYKIDIQQGAVITQEMAAQLRPGMTREQVRFVLGSPPLIDPFHAERWEYTYRFQPGRGEVTERRFTVFFDKERMARTEGDALPTEQEFIAERVRLRYSESKAGGIADGPQKVAPLSATPALPGTAQDAGPAPAQPAVVPPPAATPTLPLDSVVAPDPNAPAGSTPVPNADAPVPSDPPPAKQSPSILQRIQNMFSSTPPQDTKSGAPPVPNGPGS